VCGLLQILVISSAKVGWKKQGTCKLLDDEPVSPEDKKLASDKGWKEVSGFAAVNGGGGFPLRQGPTTAGDQRGVQDHQARQGSRAVSAEQREELPGVVPPRDDKVDLAEQVQGQDRQECKGVDMRVRMRACTVHQLFKFPVNSRFMTDRLQRSVFPFMSLK
jgi:hypothetical protein